MKVRVASAGTGKTTSLVLRYLEVIGSGTPLRRIAGVTFTRTAATELRQRVGQAIEVLLAEGEYLGQVRVCPEQRERFEEALRELDGATLTTIHGFMVRTLRLAAPSMGLDPDFEVLAEWEAQELLEEESSTLLYLAADCGHPLHDAAELLAGDAQRLLPRLFAKRSLLERFVAAPQPRARALVELFDAAYAGFERRLGARWLPPGEIERRALKLTRSPTARARLADRYRLVLLDEYQDVNPLQGGFFEALEAQGLVVEVVGDPKQSVYGFRNADVEVFRRARASGEELPALTRSYRHGQIVGRFLNRLTETLANDGRGFIPGEAPEVTPAGEQAGVRGKVEVHWLVGSDPLPRLREAEAQVLASRLQELHLERDIPFNEMAVLARSHPALSLAEDALRRAGVPAVLQQGRGYFERIEIRDLYHALRAAIEPAGVSFAAWLRGPFGRLAPAELSAVLGSTDPEGELARTAPEAAARYRRLRELVLRPPLEALKLLVREPFIAGSSFFSSLEGRQRENVDALLFTVARKPPGDLELLLDRLELLLRQSDAGDVPQSGDGVRLLTVHAAKGLEWRVAAVFDLGRRQPHRSEPVLVHPQTGVVSLPGTPTFVEAERFIAERSRAESHRLLYVAASRPREFLLLSGSVKGGKCHGWARVLESMGLGPSARERDHPEFRLAVHQYRGPASARFLPARGGTPAATPVDATADSAAMPVDAAADRAAVPFGATSDREVAPWLDQVFPHHPLPPTMSPSRVGSIVAEGDEPEASPRHAAEPLPSAAGVEGAEMPGRATALGTLVHYAISQSWSPDDPLHLANLRAQEVMFPFSMDEQDDILAESANLLRNYHGMLGHELPALAEREHDEAELPMALPQGATVWQGVIDRLYFASGEWYLDDYKTDQTVRPERYHAQLALYGETVSRVRGVKPNVRLVYLRSCRVVALDPEDLERSLREVAELGAVSQASA